MTRKYICILASLGTLSLGSGCKEDSLSNTSVLTPVQPQTELDQWINQEITTPYNIEVQYRWDKHTTAVGTYAYPPEEANVKLVLQAIKELWLQLYQREDLVGKDFINGRLPLRINLFGGRNVDSYGVELLYNSATSATEMSIYNVNDFDPKDPAKVYTLMRSVHHQYARYLMMTTKYDRDEFSAISRDRYTRTTEEIAIPLSYANTVYTRFGLNGYAVKRGFFTMLSFVSPEIDMAEIISVTLCSTPKQIHDAVTLSATPDTDLDPEVNKRYAEEAEQANKEFVQKQLFVQKYMKESFGIDLTRLQIASIRAITQYTK